MLQGNFATEKKIIYESDVRSCCVLYGGRSREKKKVLEDCHEKKNVQDDSHEGRSRDKKKVHDGRLRKCMMAVHDGRLRKAKLSL